MGSKGGLDRVSRTLLIDQDGANFLVGGLLLNIPFSKPEIVGFVPTREPSEKPG